MTFKYLSAATACALLFASPSVEAAVVTFGSNPGTTSARLGDGTVYSEAGLTFTSSVAGGLKTWQNSSSYNVGTGSALFQNAATGSITITRTDGGYFTLNSFDAADAFNLRNEIWINISYVGAAGSGSRLLTFSNRLGLATFDINLSDLTSITLTKRLGTFQMDNVRFDEGAAGAVPEPATWGMMLLGFGMIGLGLRARKTTRVTFA